MKYEKHIDEVTALTISDTNVAHMVSDELTSGPVQLANDEEVAKLIAEFEDTEGELCYAEGSIMGKYEELQQFRP